MLLQLYKVIANWFSLLSLTLNIEVCCGNVHIMLYKFKLNTFILFFCIIKSNLWSIQATYKNLDFFLMGFSLKFAWVGIKIKK